MVVAEDVSGKMIELPFALVYCLTILLKINYAVQTIPDVPAIG
jgi:hypothetical protein